SDPVPAVPAARSRRAIAFCTLQQAIQPITVSPAVATGRVLGDRRAPPGSGTIHTMPLPTHDAFASITESGPLVEWLRERISHDGRMTFRDYMEAVLYHPQYGYYSTRAAAMTRVGDYVTSPEVHPVFGALVATQIWQMWSLMGEPPRFDVVELGGGRGSLARDILEWARNEPPFAEAVRYRIVERSAALAEEQGRTLGGMTS